MSEQSEAARMDGTADSLIGGTCRMLSKNGVGHRWYVRIVDQSSDGRFIKVKGRFRAGRAWWAKRSDADKVRVPDVQFSGGGTTHPETAGSASDSEGGQR